MLGAYLHELYLVPSPLAFPQLPSLDVYCTLYILFIKLKQPLLVCSEEEQFAFLEKETRDELPQHVSPVLVLIFVMCLKLLSSCSVLHVLSLNIEETN